MIARYRYKALTWIHLSSPTSAEMAEITDEFRLPDLVAEEIAHPSERAKADKYGELIYLVLHFPCRKEMGGVVEREIDFVIGKSFLITVNYERDHALIELEREFQEGLISKHLPNDAHAGFLFYIMIARLYHFTLFELEGVNKELKRIERRVFQKHQTTMVEIISRANRELIDFKQALRFHHVLLQSFAEAGIELFGSSFAYYGNAILGEYNKVRSLLDGHQEILHDLRETNDSLLTTRTNETMKMLTALTFIMLPLSLVTGVFGMNTTLDIIFIKTKSEFFTILGAMFLLSFGTYLYFKKRRWL